jgi:hypothetical protein
VTPVYAALVHHPVKDRQGATVTTAVTNLDVHDLARSVRTYGLEGLFIVTPIEAQRTLVQRILDHWVGGPGQKRTPERTVALRRVRLAASLDDVVDTLTEEHGSAVRRLATAARSPEGRSPLTYAEARSWIDDAPSPVLVLFGTGHGLTDRLLMDVEGLIEPIRGPSDYNHLSVRAAAAITFDRLRG